MCKAMPCLHRAMEEVEEAKLVKKRLGKYVDAQPDYRAQGWGRKPTTPTISCPVKKASCKIVRKWYCVSIC